MTPHDLQIRLTLALTAADAWRRAERQRPGADPDGRRAGWLREALAVRAELRAHPTPRETP
jgi:hypothetical protein